MTKLTTSEQQQQWCLRRRYDGGDPFVWCVSAPDAQFYFDDGIRASDFYQSFIIANDPRNLSIIYLSCGQFIISKTGQQAQVWAGPYPKFQGARQRIS